MDADGAFGAGVETPADDPFAQADNEFRQEDPLADPIPTVDREGNPVEGTPVPQSEEEVLAEADRLREEQAAAEAGDRESTPGEVQMQQELAAPDPPPASPTTQPDTGATGAGEPDPQTSAPTDGGETASSAGSTENGQSPPPAEAVQSPPATEAPSEPDDTPEAEPPDELKNKKGAVTHRRYALFQPEGEGLWREVHWHEKDGKIVKKGTPGAKKQKVCLARGQEDALAFGFTAVGAPDAGAPLVAVAVTYWQLRHVAPDPVAPIRQRLKIR